MTRSFSSSHHSFAPVSLTSLLVWQKDILNSNLSKTIVLVFPAKLSIQHGIIKNVCDSFCVKDPYHTNVQKLTSDSDFATQPLV